MQAVEQAGETARVGVPRERVDRGDGEPRVTSADERAQHAESASIGGLAECSQGDERELRITVSATRDGDWWKFAVADDGVGIAPEFHDRIWGLFQTLERRDKVESTGIGLSVVRKIVESHRGTAWVESQPGGGATFFFTWPAEVEGAKRHG